MIFQIDWRKDNWLFLVVAFHIFITILSFASRRMVNFQIVLFLVLREFNFTSAIFHRFNFYVVLVFLVYFSEYLNEIGASHWQKFSQQQYFDSNGLFISVIFSCPILINCIFLLARFLYQSFDLMTKVKTAQLKQQLKKSQQIRPAAQHDKAD